MYRGAWWATVNGVSKNLTQLSACVNVRAHTHTHTHTHTEEAAIITCLNFQSSIKNKIVLLDSTLENISTCRID